MAPARCLNLGFAAHCTAWQGTGGAKKHSGAIQDKSGRLPYRAGAGSGQDRGAREGRFCQFSQLECAGRNPNTVLKNNDIMAIFGVWKTVSGMLCHNTKQHKIEQ